MSNPRLKERANRARAMAAEGIVLPATTLKRERVDDLSSSFKKVKLGDASGSRPRKQPKITPSITVEAEAADPVTPKVEVSPGLVQSQTSTTQPPVSKARIRLRFNTEDNPAPNLYRLQKAQWTEKYDFSGRLSSFLFFHIFTSSFPTSTLQHKML